MKKRKLIYCALAVIIVILGMYVKKSYSTESSPMLRITSPAFMDSQEIPSVYTCEGDDVSPTLKIDGIPLRTESLALIVEDPDAPDPDHPQTTWIHWVVFNLPADTQEIPQGFGKNKSITAEFPQAREGLTSWNTTNFGGPCPPIGSHRYYFKLYALDTKLNLGDHPTKDMLMQAMKDHVLAQAQIIGMYKKIK